LLLLYSIRDAAFFQGAKGGVFILELFLIEELEQELQALYEALGKADAEEKKLLQGMVQEKTLRLSRLIPNE